MQMNLFTRFDAMTTKDRNKHFFEVVNPRLDQLARLICEASGMDDQVLGETRYQELYAYYQEQISLGFWHPGLTETIADFTAVHDASAALPYYRLSLEQARELDLDSCSILISMAEALFEAGQKEQAEACLRDGRAEALKSGDNEHVEEADRISREMSAS